MIREAGRLLRTKHESLSEEAGPPPKRLPGHLVRYIGTGALRRPSLVRPAPFVSGKPLEVRQTEEGSVSHLLLDLLPSCLVSP